MNRMSLGTASSVGIEISEVDRTGISAPCLKGNVTFQLHYGLKLNHENCWLFQGLHLTDKCNAAAFIGLDDGY